MEMTLSRMLIILSLTVLFSLRAVRGKQMFGASLPSRAPAQWSVEEKDSKHHHCLILSGNFSLIFVHDNENPELMNEDMKRLHWRWKQFSKSLTTERKFLSGLIFRGTLRLTGTVRTNRQR